MKGPQMDTETRDVKEKRLKLINATLNDMAAKLGGISEDAILFCGMIERAIAAFGLLMAAKGKSDAEILDDVTKAMACELAMFQAGIENIELFGGKKK